MTDLPPGFRIVITNATCDHATTYVIQAEGEPTRTMDAVTQQAWAEHRRRLVEQHIRSAAREPEHDKPESWPAEIMADYQRHIALRNAADPIPAYLRLFPEDQDAVEHALTTGDLAGLRDLAHPVWQDGAYTYELRADTHPAPHDLAIYANPSRHFLRPSRSAALRHRRTDRRFRWEFAGTLAQYPNGIERTGVNPIDPPFTVGGRDFVAEMEDDSYYAVRATLNGQVIAQGELHAQVGDAGYSELTPEDSDVLNVGNVNLIFALMALDDGEQDVQVTLIIEQTDPASGQP